MEQLVEQSSLNVRPAAELVPEKAASPQVQSPGYPVLWGDSRKFVKSRIPEPNRGLVEKALDALLYLISGRRFTDSLADRQRD